MGTMTETQLPFPVSKPVGVDTGLQGQQATANAEPGFR